jgi:hypothetical protein
MHNTLWITVAGDFGINSLSLDLPLIDPDYKIDKSGSPHAATHWIRDRAFTKNSSTDAVLGGFLL